MRPARLRQASRAWRSARQSEQRGRQPPTHHTRENLRQGPGRAPDLRARTHRRPKRPSDGDASRSPATSVPRLALAPDRDAVIRAGLEPLKNRERHGKNSFRKPKLPATHGCETGEPAYIDRMQINRVVLAAAFACLALGSACRSERTVANAAGVRPDVQAAVNGEIARLDGELRRLEESTLPKGFEPLAKQLRELLARAGSSETAELRLYRLRDPFIGVEALRFVTSNHAAMNDLARFEALWTTHRDAFARVDAVRGSTLQRALHQAAANRSQVLARASLPYARSSSPGDGLYYLGEAEGNRLFAKFVAGLAMKADSPAPDRAALTNAMNDVEQQMLTAFERERSGKTTIPSSARLKEARELLARGWNDGATLLLLEARLELSKRNAGAASQSGASLKRQGSIPDLLNALSRDSKSAAAVRADVIPLFNRLYTAAAGVAAAKAPVTVTLVRWPYT
jgi:hypothetical protein